MLRAKVLAVMVALPAYVPEQPTGKTSQAVNPPQSAELLLENMLVVTAYSDKPAEAGDAAYTMEA